MNRYQPRIPTASALGVCQDEEISSSVMAIDGVETEDGTLDEDRFNEEYVKAVDKISDLGFYEDGDGNRYQINPVKKVVQTLDGESADPFATIIIEETLEDIVWELRNEIKVTEDLGADSDAWAAEDDLDNEVKACADALGIGLSDIKWSPICVADEDPVQALADIDEILNANPGPFENAARLLTVAREKIALLCEGENN